MFDPVRKSAHQVLKNLSTNAKDELLYKESEFQVMKYLIVKSSNYRDCNMVFGNTVFTFNKEGIAKVPVKGATVMRDYEMACRTGNVSPVEVEEKKPEVVEEVKVQPVVVVEKNDDLEKDIEEFKKLMTDADGELILDTGGEALVLDQTKTKSSNKKKKGK